MTKAELEAARASRVANADADGDGLLSSEELTALHVARMMPRIEAKTRRMIEMFDADGDGKLSVSELAAGPGPMMFFDRMDADGDGTLTADEAAQAGPKGHGHGRGGHGHGWRMFDR